MLFPGATRREKRVIVGCAEPRHGRRTDDAATMAGILLFSRVGDGRGDPAWPKSDAPIPFPARLLSWLADFFGLVWRRQADLGMSGTAFGLVCLIQLAGNKRC